MLGPAQAEEDYDDTPGLRQDPDSDDDDEDAAAAPPPAVRLGFACCLPPAVMGRMFVSAGLHGAACSGLRGACCRFARCGTTRPHGVQADSAQRKKLEICAKLILEYAPDKVTLLQRRPPAGRLNIHGEHITYDFTAQLNVRPSMRGPYRGLPRPAWRLATARQRPSGRATALVRRWKLSLWLCRCLAIAIAVSLSSCLCRCFTAPLCF